MKKFLWLLDNGHGKVTKGKRSPVWDDGSQLFEYEFNRYIVDGIFKEKNNCIPIVPETRNDISLRERVKRVNEYYDRYKDQYNVVLLSIHANAHSNPNAHGWEAFTSNGQTKSDVYCSYFYQEAKKIFRENYSIQMRTDFMDGDIDKEANFYVLSKSFCSAVLTENLFMTNPDECKFLLSKTGRKNIIDLHVNAMTKIENNEGN